MNEIKLKKYINKWIILLDKLSYFLLKSKKLMQLNIKQTENALNKCENRKCITNYNGL